MSVRGETKTGRAFFESWRSTVPNAASSLIEHKLMALGSTPSRRGSLSCYWSHAALKALRLQAAKTPTYGSRRRYAVGIRRLSGETLLQTRSGCHSHAPAPLGAPMPSCEPRQDEQQPRGRSHSPKLTRAASLSSVADAVGSLVNRSHSRARYGSLGMATCKCRRGAASTSSSSGKARGCRERP